MEYRTLYSSPSMLLNLNQENERFFSYFNFSGVPNHFRRRDLSNSRNSGSSPHHFIPPPNRGGYRSYSSHKEAKFGKPNRLRHGVSAPCLKKAVGDESSDSGLSSRSPTPNNQQSTESNESSEEQNPAVPNEMRKIKDKEPPNQAGTSGGGKALLLNAQRRIDVPIQVYTNSNLRRRNISGRCTNNGNKSRKPPSSLEVTGPPCLAYTLPRSKINSTAPDRFLRRSHLMEVKITPDGLTNGSSWDQLSRAIWKKFLFNQQKEETYRKKMYLWKYLYVTIKSKYPKFGLYLVGSTMTGLGNDKSDVDLCLIVRHNEIERHDAVFCLSFIMEDLKKLDFVGSPELIHAKVPILKFKDIKQGLEVDLNCNNSVGIRNTHLLYCYAQMDWRVRPLVVVIKLWANWHRINDAKNMTISSYSLALMVIHFLQYGVNPPVLPCLHSMYPDKFNHFLEINCIDMHEELPKYHSANNQTLGELLLQFFQYYSNFDFLRYAISIRMGSVIPIEECKHARAPKNDCHQWKCLCIEEPFDLTNTARSVYDPEVFKRIQNIILVSRDRLMETRNLESIFIFLL